MDSPVLVTSTPSEELLAERRRLGLDTHDEIWAGEHHMMTPGPAGPHSNLEGELHGVLQPIARRRSLRLGGPTNIGEPDDYRVPDLLGVHTPSAAVYRDSAELVVEVASPGDDSWRKFDFYAAHGVDEVLIADPDAASLHWFRLVDGAYVGVERSELLDVAVDEVHAAIDWELG
jgi:Uma2 family endonuclease